MGPVGPISSSLLALPPPSEAGQEAISLIASGKRPDIYKADFEARHGKQMFNPLANKRPKEAFWGTKGLINRKRQKVQDTQVANLLGLRDLELKGPKGSPCPVELQAQDLVFLEGYNLPLFPKEASSSSTSQGITSPEVKGPLQFSASAYSSGSQADSNDNAAALGCEPIPDSSWPRRVRRSSPYQVVCSQHGRGGSWNIANYCRECDHIAMAALAE